MRVSFVYVLQKKRQKLPLLKLKKNSVYLSILTANSDVMLLVLFCWEQNRATLRYAFYKPLLNWAKRHLSKRSPLFSRPRGKEHVGKAGASPT